MCVSVDGLNSGFLQHMWARHVVVCGRLRGGVWQEMCVLDGASERGREGGRDEKNTKPDCGHFHNRVIFFGLPLCECVCVCV